MCNVCNNNQYTYINGVRLRTGDNGKGAFWGSVGLGVADTVANLALPRILANVGSSSVEEEAQVPVQPDNNEEVVDTPKEEDLKDYENEVKKLLGDETFNGLSEEFKTNVLKKYATILTYAENNKITLTDAEKTRRLNNYIKALNSHKKELEMGEKSKNLFNDALNKIAKDTKNPTEEELTKIKEEIAKQKLSDDIKIEDSDISANLEGSDEEFYGALKSRGEGYVDMYDLDGNQIITFDEFKAFEEKDLGHKLSSEKEKRTKQFFKKIDKDKNGIDANEMAAHLTVMSRMHDTKDTNTIADITFGEWFDSRQILDNENVGARYDNIYNMYIGELKKQK